MVRCSRPVYGLIFLFRWREDEELKEEPECPNGVWFANQVGVLISPFCRKALADDLADYRQRLCHYCYVEHCEQHTRNRAWRKFASLQGLHQRLHAASKGRRDRQLSICQRNPQFLCKVSALLMNENLCFDLANVCYNFFGIFSSLPSKLTLFSCP